MLIFKTVPLHFAMFGPFPFLDKTNTPELYRHQCSNLIFVLLYYDSIHVSILHKLLHLCVYKYYNTFNLFSNTQLFQKYVDI
jgi:hypothetical protein